MKFPLSSPWVLGGAPTTSLDLLRNWIETKVTQTPDEIAFDLGTQGLEVSSQQRPPNSFFTETQSCIAVVPTLADVCERVVEEIHLLRAPPEYDVSHSEPRWRRRIFVSVPERLDYIGAVRCAESIVHEAMHLNLTNLEAKRPLVDDFERLMPSPWRAEPRSFQGVLHALYVFRCLHTYFGLLYPTTTGEVATHVCKRIKTIAEEISELDLAQLCEGLTHEGACRARQWYNS
jgi:hypothetical protein